jgi:predicted RNase H-like HicB family nuclease
MRYPIVIERGDETHAYGVIVPDLPGCFSAGDTVDEAIANAEEAILLFLEDITEEKGAPPPASRIEDLQAQDSFAGMAWAIVPIDIAKLSTKAHRVNITLPDRLLESIDAYAVKQGESRSGFLQRAAIEAMAKEYA